MRHPRALSLAAFAGALALTACGGNADSSGQAVAADCQPQHELTTVDDGVLTIASPDLPPFAQFQGSELTGVDADVLNKIAEMECLTVSAQPMDPANGIPAIQNGRVDIAAGDWYRTAERAEVVSLSDPVYVDQMGIISSDGTTSIPDLQGKTVGTVDGYLWVEDLHAYLGKDLKTYTSSSAMWQDIGNGRIDIAVDSYAAATYTNEENAADMKVEVAEPFDQVGASTEAAQATFPISQDNPGLLTAVNDDLQQLKEDGTIASILTDHGLDASGADTGAPRLIK